MTVERSGWRDKELSARHRLWGYDNPMVDVDFLVIEYDEARAVSLIDYKEQNSPRVGDPKDTNTRAFADLATDAGRSAFTVRYHRPHENYPGKGWEFFVIPLNPIAHGCMPEHQRLDEIGYASWLYKLRGRQLPQITRELIEKMQAEEVAQPRRE